MSKNLVNLVGYICAIIVIATITAAIDSLLNILLGGPFTFSFQSSLNFFAQNCVLNSILLSIFVGVSIIPAIGLSAIRKKEVLSNWVLSVSFSFGISMLSFILVFIPINIHLLGTFTSLKSLIVNAILLLCFCGVYIAVYIVIRRAVVYFKSTVYLTTAILFSVISAVITFYGLSTGPYGNQRNQHLDRPNIIIITIDTLRQDHVSVYSNEFVSTPNIDELATKSMVFKNSYTNNPWTIPALYTLNSSRYPTVHGADYTYSGITKIEMLAEVLAKEGYDTEAYIGNPLVRGEQGFEQGFINYERYYDLPFLISFRSTSVYRLLMRINTIAKGTDMSDDTTLWVTDRLEKSLDKNRDKPVFIWAHYFDPHSPLTPPKKFIDGNDEFVRRASEFGWEHTVGEIVVTEDDKEMIETLYQAEVRYVDDSLGRIFAILEERGYYENTIVIISSDHGEEMYEHGHYGHGISHYWEVMNIPMIIYLPDKEAGETSYPISLIDIMPTLIDYCAIPGPAGMSGESVIKAWDGIENDDKHVFFDRTMKDYYLKSTRKDEFTLSKDGEIAEDYNYNLIDNSIKYQPNDNVTNVYPDKIEELKKPLNDWIDETNEKANEFDYDRESKLDDIQKENLRAFGYID